MRGRERYEVVDRILSMFPISENLLRGRLAKELGRAFTAGKEAENRACEALVRGRIKTRAKSPQRENQRIAAKIAKRRADPYWKTY